MSARKVITEICSVLEYCDDRGELEDIKQVLTHVRYTTDTVDTFLVRGRDGKRYEVSIREVPPKPKAPKAPKAPAPKATAPKAPKAKPVKIALSDFPLPRAEIALSDFPLPRSDEHRRG